MCGGVLVCGWFFFGGGDVLFGLLLGRIVGVCCLVVFGLLCVLCVLCWVFWVFFGGVFVVFLFGFFCGLFFFFFFLETHKFTQLIIRLVFLLHMN